MKNDVLISIKDLEPTETAGVYRVNPSPAFLAWIANQRPILLVQPTKEEYERLKTVAAEKPESFEAKVLHHPANQDLFTEYR